MVLSVKTGHMTEGNKQYFALLFLILVLFLFLMIASLQPQRKLSAISFQMTSASVRYNPIDDNNDESTNTEQGIKISTAKTGQIHSELTGFKKNGTIENFQRAFCESRLCFFGSPLSP